LPTINVILLHEVCGKNDENSLACSVLLESKTKLIVFVKTGGAYTMLCELLGGQGEEDAAGGDGESKTLLTTDFLA
jgi:hypothetical protein